MVSGRSHDLKSFQSSGLWHKKVSLSSAVNLKHIFNHIDKEGVPMPHKEGHLLVDAYK
jgi:hypothetical protein